MTERSPRTQSLPRALASTLALAAWLLAVPAAAQDGDQATPAPPATAELPDVTVFTFADEPVVGDHPAPVLDVVSGGRHHAPRHSLVRPRLSFVKRLLVTAETL